MLQMPLIAPIHLCTKLSQEDYYAEKSIIFMDAGWQEVKHYSGLLAISNNVGICISKHRQNNYYF